MESVASSNTDEFEEIKKNVYKNVRLNGFYQLPSVRAYPVTVDVLNQMVEQGLLTKGYNGNHPIYHATSIMPRSVMVRDILANKLQSGFTIGLANDNLGQVSRSFYETSQSSFKKLGLILSVETKMLPKNIWEKLRNKPSVLKTVIQFTGSKIPMIVEPNFSFVKFP